VRQTGFHPARDSRHEQGGRKKELTRYRPHSRPSYNFWKYGTASFSAAAPVHSAAAISANIANCGCWLLYCVT
jgi:hypothetical protein